MEDMERGGRDFDGTSGAEPERTVRLDPLQFFDIQWPDRPEDPDGPVEVPAHGIKTARSAGLSITVAPVSDADETDIRHKTLQSFGRVPPRTRRVLVAKLNDARLYIEGGELVLTNTELDITFPPDA